MKDALTKAKTDWPFELPSDGWYQLIPRGEFAGKDDLSGEEILQVIDQEAIDSMLAGFRRVSAAENFSGLLIDYDHFSEDTSKESKAAGWIVELQERPDGIWFRPRWSATGETDLKSGAYRHISPSMRGIYVDKNSVPKKVRPLILDRAGLTNDPRFKNMRPLSNRGGGEPSRSSPESKGKNMKRVLALLGLAPDASEDSAVEAVTTLKNRADEAATLKNRAETAEAGLATMKQTALSAEADAFCETNKAVIKNRESIHAQYMKDPEGTKALVAGLEIPDGAKPASLKDRAVHQPGKEPAAKDQTNAQKLEAKVQEFRSQNRNCSYAQAFSAVAKANPELLKEETATE